MFSRSSRGSIWSSPFVSSLPLSCRFINFVVRQIGCCNQFSHSLQWIKMPEEGEVHYCAVITFEESCKQKLSQPQGTAEPSRTVFLFSLSLGIRCSQIERCLLLDLLVVTSEWGTLRPYGQLHLVVCWIIEFLNTPPRDWMFPRKEVWIGAWTYRTLNAANRN
jgi:hypothetical protein